MDYVIVMDVAGDIDLNVANKNDVRFIPMEYTIGDTIRMVGLKDITGAVIGPQEAYLILRGLKTLKVRMDGICANTLKVVDFLKQAPQVDKVFFPGLQEHPKY